MEEEEELPISADDLRLVDETHPGRDECPTCGAVNWYIVQGPGMALPVLPMGLPNGTMPSGQGHSLVTLTCRRCGYLKSHIKALFDRYVAGLRDQTNADG